MTDAMYHLAVGYVADVAIVRPRAPMTSSFDWKMSVLDKWESSRTPSFASPCGDKVERL
jgi:hypothetical protein